ncbi:1,6-anhydro-N-acetylmuramyl-L-alanine amidase AmpD [Thalassotalea sp. M1531]|uniref:1,6-anhydro-N-acetylmuramyl-L-alanine amidase AmpD n=1 Tax=Thalassotalea algicola TaxID=2716224 RepID=A0A7Y0LCI4_9GAMM|nr:1,6-anhydro-N-acetylmuramyl-L-alanine amidase AmpD [Thalassotalea algicola]NMP32070.1 1,6-anhydro-N-acetylmuramyl-L-alanine amidase AmpD [Thalassotalea algicola]
MLTIKNGWLENIEHHKTSHFTPRELGEKIDLLVVHNISLPPGKFGGSFITDLFLGKLDKNADPFFEEIYQLEVSAHCLIRRDGQIIQYVSFDNKAWHAGVSAFNGRERCNDFSIGIELEGTDILPYTPQQYLQLVSLVKKLQESYPLISHNNIVGHCDIAPGRKTDPGEAFDWPYFHSLLND